jgi:transcriptional regulator with XRE-family HTH domain
MTVTARPVVPAAFGDALSRLRRERGWSLKQAGMAAGVSVMTVSRAEQGHNVGLAQAVALAGAYGTTVGTLLDGPAEGPDPDPRPENRGRRPLLDARQAATVRRMHAAAGPDGKRRHTAAEIAEAVGVARSTVYGYLKEGR